ncbi:MAG: galactose oxidase-like domain-containing protein [Solirubrobacterales bacterium]
MGVVAVVLVAGNGPIVSQFVSNKIHQYEISRPTYKAKYGYWQTIALPSNLRVNAVHTALLQTGKLLVIAGSGNNQQYFEAGTFKTLVWDPATGKGKLIPTPSDMFCGGHAFLPDGKLLVAGGTARYEQLASAVKNAAGPMVIENGSLKSAHTFPKGTVFVSNGGQRYRSDIAVTAPPARRVRRAGNRLMTIPGQTEVWVEAVNSGRVGLAYGDAPYRIVGLQGGDFERLHAVGRAMSLAKEDFQGTNVAYLFNPTTERYEFVPPMPHKRWYPTVATLENGNLLAVSGLNGVGQVVPGETDLFDVKTLKWTRGPFRYFPTYPSLILTKDGRLFYTGSSTGYGPAAKGRQPGLWNVQNDTFQPVGGLPDAQDAETSGSVLLPPAQAQKVMILGGGGVGQSPLVTSRTAIADLASPHPTYTRGPNLALPTRYPESVILPDDTVLVTGGAGQYRGEHASDNHVARIYHPETNTFTKAASPELGRDYHSEAVLLPDGRVATLGSNPLYGDPEDSSPGFFEQRIEIYSPPYLFRGPRPRVTGGPQAVSLGGSASFTTSTPTAVAKVRLLHPSAATHVTDLQQRSIALVFTRTATGIHVKIPPQQSLVPLGWYMLFVDNAKGVPSIARWVKVTR